MAAEDSHEKIELYPKLEQAFFSRSLNKREWEQLKRRCESYQSGEERLWNDAILPAYSQYFGFLSALKAKATLLELENYGYLKIFQGKPFSLIDFGSGTLGGTLGSLDFFRAHPEYQLERITAIDRDLTATTWAQVEFSSFLPETLELHKNFTPSPLSNTIFLAIDVLNEMGLMDENDSLQAEVSWLQLFETVIRTSNESSLFIFIEPANKKINRNFLRFRDHMSRHSTVLLPCTHQLPCPALETDDWCHEERRYRAPSAYWNLVHSMGFERSRLAYSLLCIGKQNSRFSDTQSRMVSRPLKTKGKCEKWFCGNGTRWKITQLDRNRSEKASFFDAERGDILDSSSTGWLRPD